LSQDNEIILAQEEDVLLKDNVPGKMKDQAGTLVLTDRRLLFVEANKEEEVNVGASPVSGRYVTVRYSDVEDLNEVPVNPNNLTILLSSIETAKGSEGIFHPPELKVTWRGEAGQLENATFTEELINDRKKDLKDWAKVINGLKSGTIVPNKPKGTMPDSDSLEGKILHILGDMQEKGPMEIEEETEGKFKIELDPDRVEAALKKLSLMGFLDETPDKSGETFYRKRSPLGEDDLSS
jgi:hypothetical protein